MPSKQGLDLIDRPAADTGGKGGFDIFVIYVDFRIVEDL